MTRNLWVMNIFSVIKNGEQVSEITAHRASVSSISIKHDEKVDPNVACSVAEDGTYLTFT